MKYIPTSLCQLNGKSCFGCCGHDYTNKAEIKKGIILNTLSYLKHKKENIPLTEFRDRANDVRSSGICYNLIFENYEKDKKSRKVTCPLHPKKNNNTDLRLNHCDIHHLCKAAHFYNNWPMKKKEAFIDFIEKKDLDWYEYSIQLDNNKIINEFIEKN